MPMSIDALEEIEAKARDDLRKLAHSGIRETHAACPPCAIEGPYIAEAYENKISHEFGPATGTKKISEL